MITRTLRTPTVMRMARCMSVSIGTTIMSLSLLAVLAVGLGVPAGIANVVAVVCSTVPSYLANRRFVWARAGRSSFTREIAPFWALSFAGLIGSTISVAWVAHATAAWSDAARAIALPVANVTVWGALWLVQFFVLDRVVFRGSPA